MPNNRDDFTEKTKDLLAKRVAYRCSNPKCRKITCGASDSLYAYVNVGVAAHICAAAPGGKRYDANMTEDERKDISNGIWLCQTCSKLIDSNELRYTVKLLHEWKKDAERFTQMNLEGVLMQYIYGVDCREENLRDYSVFRYTIPMIYAEAIEYAEVLHQKIDSLVKNMEKIQQKIIDVRSTSDNLMEPIYQTQFATMMEMFELLDREAKDHFCAVRKMKEILMNEIGLMEGSSSRPAGMMFAMCDNDFYWENLVSQETVDVVNGILEVDHWIDIATYVVETIEHHHV